MSPVDICNSALIKLGVERIASFTEDSKAARICNEQYDKIRDSLLYDHYWNFAIKRVMLAKSTDTPAFGFDCKYALPGDCLRPIRLDKKGFAYKVESGFLLTKLDNAGLLYVSKEVDTSKYTPKFREALAWKLAADFAYPLVQSVSLMATIMEKAKMFALDAASTDAQEDFIDNVIDDSFIDSRFINADVVDVFSDE